MLSSWFCVCSPWDEWIISLLALQYGCCRLSLLNITSCSENKQKITEILFHYSRHLYERRWASFQYLAKRIRSKIEDKRGMGRGCERIPRRTALKSVQYLNDSFSWYHCQYRYVPFQEKWYCWKAWAKINNSDRKQKQVLTQRLRKSSLKWEYRPRLYSQSEGMSRGWSW